MQFFKLGLFATSAALFFLACGHNQPANNNSVAAGNNANAPAADSIAKPDAQPSAVDELARAREIYTQNCVNCHRENGEGGAAEFEGEKIKVPGYKSKGAMAASDEKLADYIRNGEEGEMPAFKNQLSEEEIQALVKFIRREFQGK